MNRLIVGVGTGRCGTKSLTRLLSQQPGTGPTHERYGPEVRWDGPARLWPLRLWRDTAAQDAPVAAEVAFYWTPHVETLLQWADQDGRNVRVVGLKRDRQETIDSYLRWKQNGDHWRRRDLREEEPGEWDHCYPSFALEDKAEAIGAFWDEVYDRLADIEDERVQVFCTQSLNETDGVESILEHCGYDEPVVETGIQVTAPSIEDARNSTQWQ
jgi:hypothetical protein